MSRLTKEEGKLKSIAAWNAFETLRKKSEGKKKNFATVDGVVNLANESEELLGFDDIGRSTLMQPKTKEYIALKKEIDDYREEHKKNKKLIDKKSNENIKELEEQLENAISANVLLCEEIDTLRRRLDNKENAFEDSAKRLREYSKIITELRDKYER